MRRKPYGWLVLVVGAGLLSGCDMGGESKSNETGKQGRTRLVAPGIALEPLEPVGGGPKQPESKRKPPPVAKPAPAQGPVAKPVAPPPPGPGMVRIRAEAGVGKKGHYEGGGYLVTVVEALHHTRDYVELEIKLKKTLELYEFMPGKGIPKTAEEFMKMCEENNISLPDLPPGETYVWDPSEGQLYVEKPE